MQEPLASTMGRRMKVGILVFDPGEEFRDVGVGPERSQVPADPLQFPIGIAGVEGAVTDRVDRDLLRPAAAFRHRMMPLHPCAQRAGAEPAMSGAGDGHLDSSYMERFTT